MKFVRAALVQMNFTVGALRANADKILRAARDAAAGGARLVVFPELCLCGYPPEDLVLKPHFLADCQAELARLAGGLPPEPIVVVGAPEASGARVYNAAQVFHGGRRAAVYRKMLLPNYGVFDEKRLFAAGEKALVLDADDFEVGVHICEDSWFEGEAPCRWLAAERLDAVVNVSASPYHRGKVAQREHTLARAARRLRCPLLYCNLVGGQDELVFDGGSMVLGSDGRLLARARLFREDVLAFDLPVGPLAGPPPDHGAEESAPRGAVERVELPAAGLFGGGAPADAPRVESLPDRVGEVYAALELGLRDYVDKNGFRKTVVALSGGIDSALVATIAVDALGAERVAGVTLPSRYSSAETRGDAERLARTLGIEFHAVPIQRLFEGFLAELEPLWRGRAPDATEENLQARIRGAIVMALSNKFGWLVLSTGNKSELATGYCTLYGDMVGGFALIKDVPKTLVFELARWRNAQPGGPAIPASTIERPPSAELRPNQRDSDSLPPYEQLDPVLERYVERDLGFDRIVAEGFEPGLVRRVLRLVDASEYKRRQGAPGVKITPKSFGRDRRVPITNLYRERT